MPSAFASWSPSDHSGYSDRTAAIAFGLYQRASLTNQADDFMSMRALVDRAMTLANAPAGLSLLRASAALRFHDLGAARDALRARPELAEDGDAEGHDSGVGLNTVLRNFAAGNPASHSEIRRGSPGERIEPSRCRLELTTELRAARDPTTASPSHCP